MSAIAPSAGASLAANPIVRFVAGRQLLAASPNAHYAVTSAATNQSEIGVTSVATGVTRPIPTPIFLSSYLVNDAGTTVWESTADSLLAIDTDAGNRDVYEVDVATGAAQLITDGHFPLQWDFTATDVSSDGNVFAIAANSGVFADQNVYRYDRITGTLTPGEASPTAPDGSPFQSTNPTLSADGTRMAYSIHAFGTPGHIQTLIGETRAFVDVTAAGQPGNGYAATPIISDDGQQVVFSTTATDLDGVAAGFHIAVRDLATGTGHPVSAGGGEPFGISGDGQRIGYYNLDGGYAYLYDRAAPTGGPLDDIVTLISSPTGGPAGPNVFQPLLAADGSRVLFASSDALLGVAPSTITDVFKRDLPTKQRYASQAPARLLDTRSAGSTIDGRKQREGLRRAGERYVLPIVGRAGVATAPKAVILNVTVVDPVGDGYLTVWPCDSASAPNASNLNFRAGQTIANSVIVGVGPAGASCLTVQETSANVIVDLSGVIETAAEFVATAPSRLLDTREAGATIDGQFQRLGLRPAGTKVELKVRGRAGVPADAESAVLNVTVTGPPGAGYATVWPCDTANPPNASTLNFSAGETIPNLVVAPLSPTGTVCLQTAESGAHLLADLSGYFRAGPTYIPRSPARLVDSRSGAMTIDGRYAGGGRKQPGQRFEFAVAGRAGTPAGADAAILNVTATNAAAGGYLTVWPCDTVAPPNASNVNFVGGQTIPDLVVATLSPSGTVCVQVAESAADVIIDLNGWLDG